MNQSINRENDVSSITDAKPMIQAKTTKRSDLSFLWESRCHHKKYVSGEKIIQKTALLHFTKWADRFESVHKKQFLIPVKSSGLVKKSVTDLSLFCLSRSTTKSSWKSVMTFSLMNSCKKIKHLENRSLFCK